MWILSIQTFHVLVNKYYLFIYLIIYLDLRVPAVDVDPLTLHLV